MLHCPKCTNQLEYVVIVNAKDPSRSAAWRCVKCHELYQMPQLKELLASP